MGYSCTECFSKANTLEISNLTYPSTAKGNTLVPISFTVTNVGGGSEIGDAEVYYNIIDTSTEECLFKSDVVSIPVGGKKDFSCNIKMPTDRANVHFKLSVREQDVFFDDCEDYAEFDIALDGIPQPPPLDCRSCASKKKDAIISEILANPQAKPGDNYEVTVTVEAKTLILDIPIWINIYDKKLGGCVYVGDSKLIEHGGSESWSYTGVMPDYDLELKVSAIDDTLIFKDCQDYKEFIIKKATSTKPPEPPEYINPPSFWDEYFYVIVIGLIILILGVVYFKYYKK